MNEILAAYSTEKLIQAALLEGSCVINFILWMIGGVYGLLVLVVINVLTMWVTFPTLESLRNYLINKSEHF